MKDALLIVAVACALGVLSLPIQPASAQPSRDSRVADLVKAGQLRVGLGLGTPTLAIKDPVAGTLRGPSVDLGRALAARIGIGFVPVEYPRAGAVLDGIANGAWDVSFLVFDKKRGELADFTQGYMESDFTFLVSAASSLRSLADVDAPGVRIAVERGGASDLELTRVLKHAELVRTDTNAVGIDLMRAGKVQARAAPRPVLMAELAELPGTRLLDEGFALISLGGLVPKGHAARLDYVNGFIADAKASGLINKIIESNKLPGVRLSSASSLLQ